MRIAQSKLSRHQSSDIEGMFFVHLFTPHTLPQWFVQALIAHASFEDFVRLMRSRHAHMVCLFRAGMSFGVSCLR